MALKLVVCHSSQVTLALASHDKEVQKKVVIWMNYCLFHMTLPNKKKQLNLTQTVKLP